MKLAEKICDRKIAYLFRKDQAIAFELGLLHFILARRKSAQKKIIPACLSSLYWLRKAGIAIPRYVEELGYSSQLEEIEKLLVLNKQMMASAGFGESVIHFNIAHVGACTA
ncbi:MAG: hypothetical protein KJ732_06200 [Candidatus Margulisbacteria bacterium]|nr:hypothetical protein [Candidatus Margulisiibacteriota bacterium]